jgi:hypothetical protein
MAGSIALGRPVLFGVHDFSNVSYTVELFVETTTSPRDGEMAEASINVLT